MLIAVIGGTGFGEWPELEAEKTQVVVTPYGVCRVSRGSVGGLPVVFLARHGSPASVPPHRINYRANIDGLARLGVTGVVSLNAVGSIDPKITPGDLILPDQLIDYTWGREHTFYTRSIHHIEFTFPFDDGLRQSLIAAARQTLPEAVFHAMGVYGCMQGPRLETAAEIIRMRGDGCTLVGMTAMPEAALARERNLPYAGLSVVVNRAAGMDGVAIDMDGIAAAMATGMQRARRLLTAWLGRQPR